MARDFVPDTEITTTGTRVKVYSLPANKVAYLLNIVITNTSGAAATVEIYSGSDTDTGNYRILTVYVPNGMTAVLSKDDLEGRKAIHDIYVKTDQAIRISMGLELR